MVITITSGAKQMKRLRILRSDDFGHIGHSVAGYVRFALPRWAQHLAYSEYVAGLQS